MHVRLSLGADAHNRGAHCELIPDHTVDTTTGEVLSSYDTGGAGHQDVPDVARPWRTGPGPARSALYELIRSGQLRTVKCGRRRLVPVEALAEYVASLGTAA